MKEKSPIAIAVVLFLLLLVSDKVNAASVVSRTASLSVVFVKPLGNYSWEVNVSLIYRGKELALCSSKLVPNMYYLQTKTITSGLVATPLYYVLDGVCRKTLPMLTLLNSNVDTIIVNISVPRGYIVRTSMDYRGYGPLGGPYRLPLRLFMKYYVFDGIVVADKKLFVQRDFVDNNVSVVYSKSLTKSYVEYAYATLVAVRNKVAQWLGDSPRAARVVVLVAPSYPDPMPAGTAQSMGSIIYMKLDYGNVTSWLVHTVAHETIHGWFNHGMLYGGFAVAEAVPEFLALRALHEANKTLYRLAAEYFLEAMASGEEYMMWMKVNAALWYYSLRACGTDVYTQALRSLFQKALSSGGIEIGFPQLVYEVYKLAPKDCKNEIASIAGLDLLASAQPSDSWPFVPVNLARSNTGGCNISSNVTTTTTVAVTKTLYKTVVSTYTVKARVGGARSSNGLLWGIAAAIATAGVCAELTRRRQYNQT